MKFMTPDHMAQMATIAAAEAGQDKHGYWSGKAEITSPDGLSRLSAHCWNLTGVSFTLHYRETSRSEHWNSYSVSWDFAKGFLVALSIPVKE